MKFKKYSSIENSYRTKYLLLIEESIELGYCKDDFIVEEKVHGANFAIYCDGKEIKGAKRSGYVGGDGESFYNSHMVLADYNVRVFTLQAELGVPVRIAGELYGGRYADTKPTHKGIKAVQKGVDYNPDIDFYAFDIYTYDEITEAWICMDRIKANELFEKYGFFYAKPLMRGTLEECLKYPNEFKSKIPGWLGLDEHPNDNICEGVVIKPVEYASTANGSRILLKNKNAKFEEVSHSKQSTGEKKEPVKLGDDAKEVMEILTNHITENRLRNVLSKWEGEVTNKDFGRLMGLFTTDALEDFNKDYSERFDSLEDKEGKVVKKFFGSKASQMIRDNFLNIMDKTF